MSLPVETPRRYTIEEYLRLEQDSSERHDYIDGQIVAMSGGSYNHSLIIANTIGALSHRLRGKPCRVLESNLRVGIPRIPRFGYPDVMVICGKPEFDQRDRTQQTVTNPRAIVEVLSPSTERNDRGEKFTRYQQLESLQEYLLISQDAAQVESYFRQQDGAWRFSRHSGLAGAVRFLAFDIELSMLDLYDGVEFPPSEMPGEAST